MSSPQFILDTDILSLLMRKNAAVLAKAGAYLSEHHQFTISIITRYEILRGLKAKGALRQAERFEDFCTNNKILSIDDWVILQAAVRHDAGEASLAVGSCENLGIDRRPDGKVYLAFSGDSGLVELVNKYLDWLWARSIGSSEMYSQSAIAFSGASIS